MGETRVDLHHLLEDLRDAYPGALEETILTEVVANSLDSGATCLRVTAHPAASTLTIVDDGSGMRRRDLVRYHDLASSTKARGHGIGFAGVGIKLGLLVCEDVITETRRGKEHVASRWHLAGRHKAPWKWIPPLGLVVDHGTAVQLKLHNALSPLLDEGYLEGVLRRQYQPLLEPEFDEMLTAHYPKGFRFEVNGRVVERQQIHGAEVSRLAVCLARKRKPAAVGYLARRESPFPDDQRGMAISTFGKVIKRGWDWLGITPATPDRMAGMIEAPALAAALTLNKGDFVRVGARGALYLGYRKAIQEAVSQQLAHWGDIRESGDRAGRRAVRPMERDLETVLVDLAEEFPLLASLVERRAGGQKRLPIGQSNSTENGQGFLAASVLSGTEAVEDVVTPPEAAQDPDKSPQPGETTQGEANPQAESPPGVAVVPGPRGRSRPGHYGLSIRFESCQGDPDLGRLVESTVVVNDAHPAYRRAVASRSEGYHIALAVAFALARLAVPPADEHEFVTAFLIRWGEALDGPRRRSRKRS
ncbi:MAG: ATP-binding protein [Nitrospira sp.]|nr:ATP-binding protein [Nitrospira sp.]MDH4368223.1 ATP-binding protein [Nitrospira sp.]MDH5347140.1 ATP-binding protein [Nitrospira sp.]MDH5495869.1 ATP-binding protein [Nitrospira sp.]MDH5725540.1 ATP-binding protein [Nitrospira sp.]